MLALVDPPAETDGDEERPGAGGLEADEESGVEVAPADDGSQGPTHALQGNR